jgi:hypothetical protein
MRGAIAVKRVLGVIGELDRSGGASIRQVAWELSVEESRVAHAWQHAVSEGLIRIAGRDPADGHELWRLTPGGWAALSAASNAT